MRYSIPPKPKVLFVPTANSGTAYWRIWNFAKAMHESEYAKTEVFWWKWDFGDINAWEKNLARAPNMAESVMMEHGLDELWNLADAVVVQYLHFPQTLSKIRELRDKYPNKPIFCEIDDNILSVPDYNPAHGTYDPGTLNRGIVLKQMQEADGVICSTPYLAELFEDYNDNIHVMPNSIDFGTWGKLSKEKRNGCIVIGWAGGGTHGKDLIALKPVIESITNRHKQVVFEFIGGAPADFDKMHNVRVIRDWKRIDEYPEYIASRGWHIGLTSLRDNAFNRGKSNLRWVEVSALGLPCVAYINTQNPGHTHFHQTVKQFEDGIVANDLGQLERALDTLINDRKKRVDMGIAALERIHKDFDAHKVGMAYIEVLKAAIDHKLNEDNDDEPRNPEKPCEQVCGGPESNPVQP